MLHFGAMPLCALLANLLVAPLLTMPLALLILVAPPSVLPVLLGPVPQLVGLVMIMGSWISHWPGAQLFTGRPEAWVVALLVLGLWPWFLARHRGCAALVSTHGDARSCRMAQRLAAVHGHVRLDWAMLSDPWQQTFSPLGKSWPTASRLRSTCSIALKHCCCRLDLSTRSCFPALRPCGNCRSSSDQNRAR